MMRVHIGPYKNWFGPYQLAELVCFWVRARPDEHGIPEKPEWVHQFGEWLAHGSIEPEPAVGEILSFSRERPKTWLYRLLLWIDSKRKRTVKVHIDRWDTWSMDDTLAHIILPMLVQLKTTKHGSPLVADEDVPEHLRSTAAPPKENEHDIDSNHHARWDWILDEMIFAFESKLDDSWQDQFHTGTSEIAFKRLENGMSELVSTGDRQYDAEGRKAYQTRISNGFRLFGKYYEGLWD
jgi:hypothetical protein